MSEWFSELRGPRDSEPLLARNDPPSGAQETGRSQGAKPEPTAKICEGKLVDGAIKKCEECGVRGFVGSQQYRYPVKCLRQKIAEAALLEWERWHDGGKPVWENKLRRFGDLVNYWLSPTTITNPQLKTLRGNAKAIDWRNIPLVEGAADWTTEYIKQLQLPTAQKAVLEKARKSHFDWIKEKMGDQAWSAAFVVTCVRSVEIDHGIPDSGRLLEREESHYKYTLAAKLAAEGNKINRYRTISLAEKVEVGDIIVQDRAIGAPPLLTLENVRKGGGQITHGDLVVEVNGEYATTVGGNLEFEPDFDQSGSVRKRSFPLKGSVLVRQEGKIFKQENDEGKIVELRDDFFQKTLMNDGRTRNPKNFYAVTKVEAKRSKTKTGWHPHSTARIFALLRLVDDCKPCRLQAM